MLSRNYVAQMAAGDTEAALRRFVDYWAEPGAWDKMDEGARAQMRRVAPKMVLDFQVVLPDRGPDAWRDVEPPARLLAGDKSPLPVRRIAAILARRLPFSHAAGGDRRQPPAAGHAPSNAERISAREFERLTPLRSCRRGGRRTLLRRLVAMVRAWMTARLRLSIPYAIWPPALSATTGRGQSCGRFLSFRFLN